MCLAVPARIISIADDATSAMTECMGVKKSVSLEMLDSDVAPGEYVLVHVGFAIRKVDLAIAEQTLALHREIAKMISRLDQ